MAMRKYAISEERILQINNDIAEDMGSYTKKELVEVVRYLGDEFAKFREATSAKEAGLAVKLLELTHVALKPAGIEDEE